MVLKQLTLKILHSLQMIQHLLQSADLAERTADMDEFDRQELDRLATQQRNPAEEALSIDLSDIKAEASGMEAADIADKPLDVDSEIEDDIDERIREELEDIGEVTGRQNGTDND